ncbi:MAG: carbohydrate ABC transporter permease [Halorhabdus sp.]
MSDATGTITDRGRGGDDVGVADRFPLPSISFEMKLLLPSIVFLALLSIIPLIALLWMSVSNFGRVPTASPEFVGLQHYTKMFGNTRLLNSWKTTFIYAGASLVLQVVLGVSLAVSLDILDRGENMFTSIIIMPMMVAPVAAGLIWDFLLSSTFGLYGVFLVKIGVTGQAGVLANEATALPALIIMDTWQWTPLVVLIVLARLKSVPDQLYEAASVDGASGWQTFRYVTYPLIKPAIGIALLIRSMDLLRFFDKIFITTGGGPADATKVIGMFIYEMALRQFEYGRAAALGVMLMIVTIILGLVFVELYMGGAGDDA